MLFVHGLQHGKHGTLEQRGADNKECTVGQFLNNGRIGHYFDGRTVYEDIIVFWPYFINQVAEALLFEQFCGIGGNNTYGQNTETQLVFVRHYNTVDIIGIFGQIVT